MKKLLSILLLSGSLLLTGCGDSENFVFTNTPNNQVAPVCVDDAYSTNQNTQLTVNAANGVLANDSPNGGSVTEFDATSTQGGAVNVNGDGSFTYTPPNNFFDATDTFTYTVTSDVGQTSCTVTITVVAVNGFFVDSVNGDDMTGSFNGGLPFQTVQAAVTAAGTNQDIIVRPGNYAGAVTLLDGQRLLGSGSSLVNLQGGVRPVFSGPINMADGNTVDFVRVDGTNGNAIDAQNRDGGTVTDCEVANLTNLGVGVNLNEVDGTWNVIDNDITNVAGIGIRIVTGTNDITTAHVNNNVTTNNSLGAIAFTSASNSQCAAEVKGNTMTGTVNTGGTFQVITGNTATFCTDIEGNTNDDAYQFQNNDATATLQVEQLGQLTTINNGSAVVDIPISSEQVDDVPNGTCGF